MHGWGRGFPDQRGCASASRSRFLQAASSEVDDRLDLVAVQAIKPLKDVVNICPGLKVLKDGCNGHPCAAQHPCTAHLSGNSFHRRTLRPVEDWHFALQMALF